MFVIRPATPADLAALSEIFLATRRETFFWCDPETFRLEDFGPQTEGEIVHVAADEANRPLGFISIWLPENFIHHLYIDPGRQRMGIGTLLLDSLAGWLPWPHRLKCLVENHGALAFYRRHGWREQDRGIDAAGEYLVMEKEEAL